MFSSAISTIGSRDNFAPSLIDGVTFTKEPIDPGTAPFIKSKLSSKSIFSISRFWTVVFLSPIWPAIFFPLNTLPGNWHCPIEPGALWARELPCVASCVLKLCLFTTPANPLPFETPETSTFFVSLNGCKVISFASCKKLNSSSDRLNSVR